MKISMVSTLPPIKGLSPYTLALTKELSKVCEIDFYGFKSIYPSFLYPGGTKTKERKPSIKNLNNYEILTWYNPLSWIRVGFMIKTPIIHVQWWSWFLAPIYLTILLISKVRNKKVIMTLHNIKPHEKSLIKNFLNNSVIGLADEYIVHSKENKDMFLSEFKTKKPVHIVKHGVIEFPIPTESTKFLRNKYGYNSKDKILLFFGNIRDYKGLDILLESVSKIKDNNLKLIIAGKPWKDFKEYSNLIEKLNLKDKIQLFLDYNDELRVGELFKLADLVVFPYKEFEASSGAASTALFFEKPLVVTNVGGLTELVYDKKVIAKPNDSLDLKEKLIYALHNLKKLENYSKIIAKKFSWKSIAGKTLETYNGITN